MPDRLFPPARPLLATALALLLVAGCDRAAQDDSPSAPRRTATSESARLVLTVAPENGDVPLATRFTARLEGVLGDEPGFGCPTLAWTLGNGDVILSRATDCGTGSTPRDFALDYTYRTAGSFDASVRLLALNVPASNPVSVLARGPTATPAPVAAVPGPTIVIATAEPPTPTVEPAATDTSEPPTATTVPRATATSRPTRLAAASVTPRRSDTPAPATATRRAPTQVAIAPAVRPSPTAVPARATATAIATGRPRTAAAPATTAAPATNTPAVATAVAGAGGRVLPADLYYLADRPARLWRVPDSGGPPAAVVDEAGVADYAVTSAGLVAYTTEPDGALRLALPAAEPLTLAAGGTRRPVWTREGRKLAYATKDGITVYDLATGTRTQLAPEGEPLAWSRDGRWLAARRPDGLLTLVSSAGLRRDLPVGPVAAAGWLPDRDVLWVAGDGLRLLSVDDTIESYAILPPEVPVLTATITPDQRLLALGGNDAGIQLYLADLKAPTPLAAPVGPPLDVPTTVADIAWAPDGQTVALADGLSLRLAAPATGASVPLLSAPARRPTWVLSSR